MLVLSVTPASGFAAATHGGATNVPPSGIGGIAYGGGDGTSIQNAVVIENAKNELEGIRAESAWIERVHPGWRKERQALLAQAGRYYDKIDYATPDSKKRTIYFDITDFFGKY